MCVNILYGLCLLLGLSGCVTDLSRYGDAQAEKLGFERSRVLGQGFQHVIYQNRIPVNRGALHVYIDGDGSPYIREYRVAKDPGPRNLLMLKLMALDEAPSLYLGRPCYNGLAATPPCSPAFWTLGRYSSTVVESMAEALQRIVIAEGIRRLVFIGYSGGGALAMLLAERVAGVTAVVTIAGNLDTAVWTRLHGYSPLLSSLNPAERPPLSAEIYQLHVVGELDTVVPPAMVQSTIASQKHAELMVVQGFDHVCCWQDVWRSILAAIAVRRRF